jgi:glycine/D-amino acid oxidase-like deaminating enzyme
VIHTGEVVRAWSATSSGVRVETDGECYVGGHLVITAGAWLATVAAELDLPLRVERQVQTWFEPKVEGVFRAERMPAFIHFLGEPAYYGIPMREAEGIKVARHHGGRITSADTFPTPMDRCWTRRSACTPTRRMTTSSSIGIRSFRTC